MLRKGLAGLVAMSVEHGGAPGRLVAEAERENEQAAAHGDANTALCNAVDSLGRVAELNVALRHAISEAERVQEHFGDHGDISGPLSEAEVASSAKVYKNAFVSHANNGGKASTAQHPFEQVGGETCPISNGSSVVASISYRPGKCFE